MISLTMAVDTDQEGHISNVNDGLLTAQAVINHVCDQLDNMGDPDIQILFRNGCVIEMVGQQLIAIGKAMQDC